MRRLGPLVAVSVLVSCSTSPPEPLHGADAMVSPDASTDGGEQGDCALSAQWCGQPANCCTGLSCIESGADRAMVCARIGGRAVGAPCQGAPDCMFACVTDPRFAGGYCTEPIAECAAGAPDGGDANCVSGSICANGLVIAGLGAPDLCLATCSNDSDCRAAEGYHCCTYRASRVCYPAPNCP
jgi:hypothetical protein